MFELVFVLVVVSVVVLVEFAVLAVFSWLR